MNYKERLEKANISIRAIARSMDTSHSVVSQVLNNKYDGAEETKKEVIKRVEFMLRDKVDLNPVIYDNIGLFIKVIDLGMVNKKFTIDERILLTQVYKDLDKYKNTNEAEAA